MISTVTTSTVSTVTLAGSFALVGILVLLGLLIQKELSSATTTTRFKKLDKVVNIGIVPLLIIFAVVVVAKVVEVLK